MKLFSFANRKKRIFLDYASATPVRPEVREAMEPYWSEVFANPSSRHADGEQAREALEGARKTIAKILQVKPTEITFTSGGTEGNNAMFFGVARALEAEGRSLSSIHLVVSAIEHPSVLEAARELSRRGAQLDIVSVNADGMVTPEALERAIKPETALVSVMYVNNEVGSVNALKELVEVVRKKKSGGLPYIHTDAAQAPLYLSLMPHTLGVDAMTLDAQKIYGPKGVGLLYHSHTTRLRPYLIGGSQEGGMRAGTPPVPLIVGLAKALEIADRDRKKRSETVASVRDHFLKEVQRCIPNARINGPQRHRIPNNLNISLPGIEGEYLAALLDKEGVSASTKSACMELMEPSFVVDALYGDRKRATESIRFALGEETTRGDVDRVVAILTSIAKKFDVGQKS